MAYVQVIAVEKDVMEKLDVTPISEELKGIDVAILYSCTNDRAWRSREWNDHGQRTVLIKLPYKTVKRLEKEEVKMLMLARANERLKHVA